MSFENDYNAFVESINLSEFNNTEKIISGCDCKKSFIERAIADFDKNKVVEVVNSFRSLGLRRNIEKILNEYNEKLASTNISESSKEKIVLVHHKNKVMNELLHLSGSSFVHERNSKEDLLFNIQNSLKSKKIKSA